MDKNLLRQLFRFAIVGALAFCVDYGTLMFCRNLLGISTMIATGVGFIVSVVFNYVVSMRYVFVSRSDISRQREFFTFVVLSCVGLLLNELIMGLGLRLFADTSLIVTVWKVLATFVVMIWNFVSRKVLLDDRRKT